MPKETQKLLDSIQWSKPLLEEDDMEAAIRVIRSGWLTQGKETRAFEDEIADVVQAKHAVMVNNGTAALIAALMASDIGPGDEVLVPTMTFIASVNVISLIGATPVLVDCNPKTLNVDVETLKAKLTPKTKAILFVDFCGMPCDIDGLTTFAAEHNLVLIEDAAQALGASYKKRPIGSFANVATFSMHMAKVVPTAEGGCVVTQDDQTAERLRQIRNHGMLQRHNYVGFGLNFRITDIQSAIGRSQLKKLDRFIEHRQEMAQLYRRELDGWVTGQEVPEYVTRHPYMIYSVFFKDQAERDVVRKGLNDQGIDARVCWTPVHQQPYHQKLFAGQGKLPFAETVGETFLSLPLGNGSSREEVLQVANAVKQELKAYRGC